jgi:hypothetical protein
MFVRFFASREFASASEKAVGRRTRRTRRRRPAVEALEGRALLSFLGSESLVSLNPQNTMNFDTDNASSPDRTSVAVWVNDDSGKYDIWAQRFDSLGRAAGAPIAVDSTAAESYNPHVSMDGQGRFVVTWEDFNPDGTSSVLMRYYSATGAPVTGITRLTPAGSSDLNPDVAASDGSFVIAWTHLVGTTNEDIDAERFVISGGVPSGQGVFGVSTDAAFEDAPSAAMSPDGRFDIAYERLFSGGDWDIIASQYGNTGNLLRSNIIINGDPNKEIRPSISMDNAGNAAVAYMEYIDFTPSIYANRLSSDGSVGGQIDVQYGGVGAGDFDPSVALARTGGRFVVAYGTNSGVQVTEIGSNDVPLATVGSVGVWLGPAISVDGLGRYLMTYSRYNPSDSHADVFSRRDLLSSEDRVSLNPQATDNSAADNASSSSGFSVAVWVNTTSFSNHDIWAQRFDSLGRAAGAPIAVDSTAADSYAPHVSMDGQGRFVVAWEDLNPDGTWSVLMRYHSASGAPLNGITRVSAPGSNDLQPDVAASDGSFVIAWTHNYSLTFGNIWAERFVISGGVPSGKGRFRVSADTHSQASPSVAMSPDGRFDIAYDGQSGGNDWDILASQYGNTGNRLRSNIIINDDPNLELSPSISMDNAGNAVIAYEESIGSDYGIYANRLSSGGSVGGRITVRNDAALNENRPSVVLAPTGGQFVVAYGTHDIRSAVQVTEMGSNDVPLTTLGPITGFNAAISIDGYDRYVVTYTQFNSATGHEDIFSRRYFLS